MKVSKKQVALNREALVDAASREIRVNGFDGLGVAALARSAGLTHGAFYKHFGSKSALLAEACGNAFADCSAEYAPLNLAALLEIYLSNHHRDNPADGCPTAALVSEAARQPAEVQTRFVEGIEEYIRIFTHTAGSDETGSTSPKEDALFILSAMMGALALSRAVVGINPGLSEDILVIMRTKLAASNEALRETLVSPKRDH